MAWNARHPGIADVGAQTDAETAEQGFDIFGGNLVTQHLVDFGAPQAHRNRFRLTASGLRDRMRLAAANLQHELGCAFQRLALQARIDAALEAIGGIREQLVAATAADRKSTRLNSSH